METDHWRRWWGEPETELGVIADMVEGRDTTRPFLILLDGQPVGYIQVWILAETLPSPRSDDTPWMIHVDPRSVGVDLSIGEANNLSRGIGSAALSAFVAMLRAEGHDEIVIDPDPENGRAIRAYEKAGFVVVPHLSGPEQGVVVMRHDPTAKRRPGQRR